MIAGGLLSCASAIGEHAHPMQREPGRRIAGIGAREAGFQQRRCPKTLQL